MLKLDRETILEAVHRLPPDEQVEIAHEILRTAVRRELPPAPGLDQSSAMSFQGIASTPEPLDEERLLDESRMERFGA